LLDPFAPKEENEFDGEKLMLTSARAFRLSANWYIIELVYVPSDIPCPANDWYENSTLWCIENLLGSNQPNITSEGGCVMRPPDDSEGCAASGLNWALAPPVTRNIRHTMTAHDRDLISSSSPLSELYRKQG
jgi:hypothetical protein